MSRRPPSARSPRLALFRALPAVQRAVPGHLQARAAQPLPRPLPSRQVAAGGGDSTHSGTGASSVALGPSADASGDFTVAVGESTVASGSQSLAAGSSAEATGTGAVAVGASTEASATSTTAIGASADADHNYATAIGQNSYAGGIRAVAIGRSAYNADADTALIKANSLEVKQSSPGPSVVPTSLILADPDGNRWQYTPDTSGNLIPTAL